MSSSSTGLVTVADWPFMRPFSVRSLSRSNCEGVGCRVYGLESRGKGLENYEITSEFRVRCLGFRV
jgi:hypothetical protein